MDQRSMSVVVCAYTDERWEELSSVLRSLSAQTYPAHEVIVVIDHNDDLLARVRTHFPAVLAIPNSEQRGLSGARNSGVARATGAIIAFLDDDACAAPDWLEQLQAPYDDPVVQGVGGAVKPVWAAGRPHWFPAEFDWVVGCTYRGMPDDGAPVRNFIGANMSFRRSVFEAIGGFRHGIGRVGKHPLGREETELCIRLRQHWPQTILRYTAHARVFHQVPKVRGRWAYFRARCYAEGLSKALVAQLVGQSDGLSSERSYVTATLPAGVVRNLAAAVRGTKSGYARAAAIIAGLSITTSGYTVGRLSRLLRDPWRAGAISGERLLPVPSQRVEDLP